MVGEEGEGLVGAEIFSLEGWTPAELDDWTRGRACRLASGCLPGGEGEEAEWERRWRKWRRRKNSLGRGRRHGLRWYG